MAKTPSYKKRRFGLGFFFKLIFSLAFLLLTVVWVFYTLHYLNIWKDGWDFFLTSPLFQMLDEKVSNDIQVFDEDIKKLIGIRLFLFAVATLLLYLTILFPIKKIPLLGSIVKFVTGFIPALAGLGIIVGAVLVWAIP